MAVGDIKNFVEIDGALATAGQPTELELAELAACGFEVVVNLGLLDPRYALPDEASAVRALGLEYHHLPVDFQGPTLEEFRKFRVLVKAVRGRKTFVHCAMNYRVACFTALFGEAELGWSRQRADQHVRRVWEPNPTWLAFLAEVRARAAHVR